MITLLKSTNDNIREDISSYIENNIDLIIDGNTYSSNTGFFDQYCICGVNRDGAVTTADEFPLLMNHREDSIFHKIVYVTTNISFEDKRNYFDQIIYITNDIDSSHNTIKKKYYRKNYKEIYTKYLIYRNNYKNGAIQKNKLYKVEPGTSYNDLGQYFKSDTIYSPDDRPLEIWNLNDLNAKLISGSQISQEPGVIIFKANDILTKNKAVILNVRRAWGSQGTSCYFAVENNDEYSYNYLIDERNSKFRSGRYFYENDRHRVIYTMDLNFKDYLGLFDKIIYVSDKDVPSNSYSDLNPRKEAYYKVDYDRPFYIKAFNNFNLDMNREFYNYGYTIDINKLYTRIYKLPFQTTDVFYNGLLADEWKVNPDVQNEYISPMKIIKQNKLLNNTKERIYLDNHTLTDEYVKNHRYNNNDKVPSFIYKSIRLKSNHTYKVNFKIRANYIFDTNTKEIDKSAYTYFSRHFLKVVNTLYNITNDEIRIGKTLIDYNPEADTILNNNYGLSLRRDDLLFNSPDDNYTDISFTFEGNNIDEYFDYKIYLLITNYPETHYFTKDRRSFPYIEIKDFSIENLEANKNLAYGEKIALNKENTTWELDSELGELNDKNGYISTTEDNNYLWFFNVKHYDFYYQHDNDYRDKPFLFTNLKLKPNTKYVFYLNFELSGISKDKCRICVKIGNSSKYINAKDIFYLGNLMNYCKTFTTDETGNITFGFKNGDYVSWQQENAQIRIKEFSYLIKR